MAKFVFKLQAVLTQRREIERRAQLVVAGLEAQRVELEGRIRRCQEGILAAREDLRVMLGSGGGVDLRGVRSQAAASLALSGAAHQHVLTLSGIHHKLAGAREALRAAVVRRRAVELLRDAQREAWRRAEDRKDEGALDELAVTRAGLVEDAA